MKRSIATSGIFAVVIGAAALAGERTAFDGMGAMMLEHEANETFEQVSSDHVSDGMETGGQCEEQRRLDVRVRDMERSFEKTYSRMAVKLEMKELAAVREKAFLASERIAGLKAERAIAVATARKSVSEHKAAFAQYRHAVSDRDLVIQVEDALAAAEQALAQE